MDSLGLSGSDPLRPAAESFIGRLRRGDRPTLAEYTERFPDLAPRIRELFPKLLAAERKADRNGETGPYGLIDLSHGIPKTIGDYQIVREIGRGGMGIVYEAVQESLGRQVALKVLPAGPFSRGPYLERFYREARAAGRLHHTNIVPVFGVGQADHVHYYAMQYIEGMGLDAVIKEVRQRRGLPTIALSNDTQAVNRQTRGSSAVDRGGEFELGPASILPLAQIEDQGARVFNKNLIDLASSSGTPYFRSVARLGIQVAEALAYAHAQNVLHRDIKPSNLLLDKHGILWITDFGLAKAEGEDLSGPDDVLGTLRYMAPERFKGRSDSRSDIYALGMTLYELIALVPAFDDDDRFRLVERINCERPKKLHVVDPTVPRDLETIIIKSIQRDAIHRYSSAAEMADDLRLFLSDRPIAARRAGRIEEIRRWCRRNPIVATLGATVAMLGFVLAAVIYRAYVAIGYERDQMQAQKLQAESNLVFANEFNRHSLITSARLRRTLHKVGQRFAALDALESARRLRPDGANAEEGNLLATEATASLALPDIRRLNSWLGWPDGTVALDFDDSFEHYARSDEHGNVSIRSALGDNEIAVLPGLGGPASPRFGSSGAFLAVKHDSDGRFVVWRIDKEPFVKVIEEPANVSAFAFGPDDKHLAIGYVNGNVTIKDLKALRSVKSFAAGATVASMSFRPDGQLIAVATEEDAAVFDVQTGSEVKRIEVPGVAARIAWHPDGQRLAIGTKQGHIRIHRRIGQMNPLVIENATGTTPDFLFDPRGDVLVSVAADRTIHLWCPCSGRLLLSTTSIVSQPRFSKDGRLFGPEIENNRIHMLEMAAGHECRGLKPTIGGAGTFQDAAISSDHQLFALAASDGVLIWDLATGDQLARLPVGDTTACLFRGRNELLTSGASGVFSWPIQWAGAQISMGPPQQLASWPCERLAQSADGSTIAVAAKFQGAMLLSHDRPTIRNTLLAHDSAAYIAVSPNGRHIATGTQGGRNVRIWDAGTNRLIRELDVKGSSSVAFSPDGRLLATNSADAGVQLWSTSNWTVVQTIPSARVSRLTFSPTMPLIAVESGNNSIRIYDTRSAMVCAELISPDDKPATWLAFSPDGSSLLTSCSESHMIRIWDLPAIHRGLESYGMSWPIPVIKADRKLASISDLRIVGSELTNSTAQARLSIVAGTLGALARPNDGENLVRRGTAFADLGFDQIAMNEYSAALRVKPDHGEAAYLRGSENYRRRQWKDALDDFSQAMKHTSLFDVARWMRGKSLLQLDRVDEMITEVNDLLQHYPDDPQLYYQRALGHAYRKDHRTAINDLETALRKGQNHDLAMNNLAWILVTGPPEIRDPDRALGFAQRAVRLVPTKATYYNTLGVCLFRLERYKEALAALEKCEAFRRGQIDGYDLYIAAMCWAKLDETARSREYMERARQWQRNTQLTAHEEFELKKFQKEAEELTGDLSSQR